MLNKKENYKSTFKNELKDRINKACGRALRADGDRLEFDLGNIEIVEDRIFLHYKKMVSGKDPQVDYISKAYKNLEPEEVATIAKDFIIKYAKVPGSGVAYTLSQIADVVVKTNITTPVMVAMEQKKNYASTSKPNFRKLTESTEVRDFRTKLNQNEMLVLNTPFAAFKAGLKDNGILTITTLKKLDCPLDLLMLIHEPGSSPVAHNFSLNEDRPEERTLKISPDSRVKMMLRYNGPSSVDISSHVSLKTGQIVGATTKLLLNLRDNKIGGVEKYPLSASDLRFFPSPTRSQEI